jgi:hypothetical protein
LLLSSMEEQTLRSVLFSSFLWQVCVFCRYSNIGLKMQAKMRETKFNGGIMVHVNLMDVWPRIVANI